jgi:hypothetical protein
MQINCHVPITVRIGGIPGRRPARGGRGGADPVGAHPLDEAERLRRSPTGNAHFELYEGRLRIRSPGTVREIK